MNLNKKNQRSDEIDLIEIFLTILSYKWKIILTTCLAVLVMFIYQTSQQSKFQTIIEATTEIRPISIYDAFGYESYNSYIKNGSFNGDITLNMTRFESINAEYLLNLFMVKFNDNEFIKDQMKKFNFIEKKNFENTTEYENMLTNSAYSFNILAPNPTSKINRETYTRIIFRTTTLENWKKFLKYVEKSINQKIQLHIKDDFNKKILSLKKTNQFKIDAIELKINEELEKYEIEASKKLIYLDDQAKIARTLGIAKNNPIPAVDYMSNTSLLVDALAKIPYYMRGYEMIEKEIDLFKKRNKEKPITQIIVSLEQEKKRLLGNKKIERLQDEFNLTPIFKKKNFHSAKIIVDSTSISIDKNDRVLKLFYTGLIALMLSTLYALMMNALRNRR